MTDNTEIAGAETTGEVTSLTSNIVGQAVVVTIIMEVEDTEGGMGIGDTENMLTPHTLRGVGDLRSMITTVMIETDMVTGGEAEGIETTSDNTEPDRIIVFILCLPLARQRLDVK